MPDEEECVKLLREVRWPDGVSCVGCGSSRVVRDGVRRRCYQMYWCKACGLYFNDRSGTMFDGSKLPLRVWFFTAFLMQFNISILEISRVVGVNYRNFYYVAKRIRENVYTNQIVERLKGIVEMDETYVTAGLKGKKGSSILEGQVSRSGGGAPMSMINRLS